MQHNLLVHKNKENEETIASLHRDLEHCQCMYINFMYVVYIYTMVLIQYVCSLTSMCMYTHTYTFMHIHAFIRTSRLTVVNLEAKETVPRDKCK